MRCRRLKIQFLFIFTFGMIAFPSFSQTTKSFKVMFYNTENLFDAWDDSTSVGDDEFLPSSARYWTFKRYKQKINNISKVVLAAGEWQAPALIGLCEVENETVLKHLIYWTGLSELHYRFIHYNSPDLRGIDVALLYRADRFHPLESRPVKVTLPDGKLTRDILLVKGVMDQTDTLYVMVNHWPSRMGGAQASEVKRLAAANVVVGIGDSIRQHSPDASILLMGDFNDSPVDSSIVTLGHHDFFNFTDIQSNKGQGTNKYRQDWENIDQILISKSMQAKMKSVTFRVVDLPFLLVDDEVYLGKKLFRTYVGPRYQGGFSDHLPVMATFEP